MKEIMKLRDAAAVTRWHTMRTQRTQTLAEHSFGVAQLALYIYPQSSAALLSACLWHDLAEYTTGDMPAQVKWRSEAIKNALERLEGEYNREHNLVTSLTKKEKHILKWCDSMELILWCHEELELGNRHPDLMRAIDSVLRLLSESGHPTATAERMYDDISKRYTTRRGSLQRASL